ncbi:hypothetical protein JIN87_27450 [Pelagicoccus mobilis]|uniref:Uncharacterized protein n=1 Tax=Pelagicoccus mobilis TaxID=415221 RepID=A0A934S889_9BACT|nr:hypothetical protein [Pelagicoccus mobilis]
MKNTFACMLLIALLAVAGRAQEISPFLLGQNHWMADGDEGRVGYLHELWDKVGESGVQTIRIGGNGYQQLFPESRELDEMIDRIKAAGAEPILQVPSTFTEFQAKALVERYSKNDGRDVMLWSIGNEPFLHEEFTLEEVHAYIVRIGTAMKEVNSEITLFVYDAAWMQREQFQSLVGGELDVCGLKVGDAWLVDGLTFHSYPNGTEFGREDVTLGGPNKIEGDMVALKEMASAADEQFGRTGEDKLLWGLTEVHVTYANPDREIAGYGNTSFLAGQFIAEVFGNGMKHGATLVNQWCINETDAVKTDFGYIGLPGEFYPRSTYYHMQLMSQHMNGMYLSSEDSEELLKVFATEGDDRVAVLLMNQELGRTIPYSLRFDGDSADGEGVAIRVHSDLAFDYEDTIEAQMTELLVFGKEGKLLERWRYGLSHALTYQKPELVE